MDRFIDGLPGCFRMYDPDKSMDDGELQFQLIWGYKG